MHFQREIEALSQGQTVSFRPSGNSMTPRIKSKQLVTVSPDISHIQIDDIVLCKVRGNILAHLISAIQGERYQISNNHGRINGWTTTIYGVVINVSD